MVVGVVAGIVYNASSALLLKLQVVGRQLVFNCLYWDGDEPIQAVCCIRFEKYLANPKG